MTCSEWQAGYVTANGIKIHYWRTGGDKPVIVMSHGITDNGLCWTTLARALEADYDIVMYDARGHGLSDKPETGYGIDDQLADLVGLVEVLELRGPILMGHSMGGAIVAATAAQHPDLPRAVVLEDPVHMGPRPEPSPEEWTERAAQIRAQIAKRNAMTREQLVELGRTQAHPGWPEESYGPWADAKLEVSPSIVPAFNLLPDLRESFPKITAPTLILKADTDDERKKKDLEAAALLPNGKLIHVEGAGHNVRRDKPEAMLKLLRAFLSNLP